MLIRTLRPIQVAQDAAPPGLYSGDELRIPMGSEVIINQTKNRAIPYLSVHDAEHALELYSKAFGAKEVTEGLLWGGKIGHAELEFEGARVMLADEFLA